MNEVRKIRGRTGNYIKIIEVNAPIRFYWTEDGFDGIEASFNARLLTPYQKRLFDNVLEAVRVGMQMLEEEERGDIPRAFKEAFEGKNHREGR